ncbi:MAG: hypothetical protein ACLRVU_10775 [Beduini sp.]
MLTDYIKKYKWMLALSLVLTFIIILNYPKIEQDKERNCYQRYRNLLKDNSFLFIFFLAVFNNIPMKSVSSYIGSAH